MYSSSDTVRSQPEESTSRETEEYRSDFRKDYARLIHSPSFRRLQGKTQLYPGIESDFFRNRLTHSLEVAQISKSIAIRINNRYRDPKEKAIKIDPDICEFAGLAHDLGHPPFGHQGEEALDECMAENGGFEGNAQTLRILGRLEKKIRHFDNQFFDPKGKDLRKGLNLTYRSLASILKYDKVIPEESQDRKQDKLKPVKGYYFDDQSIVDKIKENVIGTKTAGIEFKTVECMIMDVADDIAYSTYDLEDGLKAGFFTPIKILFSDPILLNRIRVKINQALSIQLTTNDIKDGLFDIFGELFADISLPKKASKKELQGVAIEMSYLAQKVSNIISNNGAFRTDLTSSLVGQFIRGVDFKYNKKFPAMSKVFLTEEIRFKVELLKTFTFESQILSSKLKIAEYRGKEIIKEIFKAISSHDGWRLMPDDHKALYEQAPSDLRKRVICDYIAGMTDRYAIEFYGRLKSENPETIFKPL